MANEQTGNFPVSMLKKLEKFSEEPLAECLRKLQTTLYLEIKKNYSMLQGMTLKLDWKMKEDVFDNLLGKTWEHCNKRRENCSSN